MERWEHESRRGRKKKDDRKMEGRNEVRRKKNKQARK